VQVAPVLGYGMQVTAVGFDFFELVFVGVVAVRAAAYPQTFEVGFKTDFSLVTFTPPCGDQRMAGNTFLRGRRRRETQIKIALFGRELAQRSNSYKVFQEEKFRRACVRLLSDIKDVLGRWSPSCGLYKLSVR